LRAARLVAQPARRYDECIATSIETDMPAVAVAAVPVLFSLGLAAAAAAAAYRAAATATGGAR
jgi:hypothetical protein